MGGKEIKLKSENSFTTIILILLLGGSGFLAIAYHLLSTALNQPYPQIFGVVLGSFFGIFGILSILSIYSLDSIFIYSDRMVVKSLFGSTKAVILLNDIISWTEIKKENKYSKWTDLTVYTQKKSYELSSMNYNNYLELKRHLTRGKKRDLKKQKKWVSRSNLYFGIGFVVLGALFMYLAFFINKQKDNLLRSDDIYTLTGIITNKAEIQTGSKNSEWITIKLKTYPTFNFKVENYEFDATNSADYVHNVKIGDTLRLDIEKEEYLMKLSKEKPLDFWSKTVSYTKISVFGLSDKTRTYLPLSLSDHNRRKQENGESGFYFYGIIGALACIAGLYFIIWRNSEKL